MRKESPPVGPGFCRLWDADSERRYGTSSGLRACTRKNRWVAGASSIGPLDVVVPADGTTLLSTVVQLERRSGFFCTRYFREVTLVQIIVELLPLPFVTKLVICSFEFGS